jgi:hypothetical protein
MIKQKQEVPLSTKLRVLKHGSSATEDPLIFDPIAY